MVISRALVLTRRVLSMCFFLKGKNGQKTHYMIKCFPLHFAPRLCPMERAKRGNE